MRVLVLALLISLNIFALEVASPKAPPSIPLLDIKGVELNLYTDVNTEIIPSVVKGRGELYVLPTNLGAKLYNKGADIKLLGSLSSGLLSLVSSDIEDIRELEGQKLYIGGQGASPDVVTRSILKARGIDANIMYRSSQEIAKLLMAGRIKNAILPEPLATMVLNKNKDVVRIVELKDLWDSGDIPQVGLFINTEVLEEKSIEVESLLKEYNSKDIDDNTLDIARKMFGLRMSNDDLRESMKYMNLGLKRDRASVDNYLKILGITVGEEYYAW